MTPQDTLRFEWRDSFDEFLALEQHWRALEDRIPDRMVFGTFDHMVSWYRSHREAYGPPLIGVAWRATEVVGILPLVFRKATLGRVPVRRFDGAGMDGETGEILFPRSESEALTGLLDSLVQRGGFDVFDLFGVAPGSWRDQAIVSCAERHRLSMRRIPYRYATIDLSRGFEAYQQGLSAKLRGNLRRREKRAKEMGEIGFDRIHRPVDRATLHAHLNRVFGIAVRSWKAVDGDAMKEHYRRFYRDLCERFNDRGLLDLSIMTVGGRDASFIVGLRERETFYDVTVSYDEGFAGISPGTLLIQEVAKRIAAEGIRLLVSHGDREYKRYWASEWIPQVRTIVFGRGLRASASRLARFTIPEWVERLRGTRPRPVDKTTPPSVPA